MYVYVYVYVYIYIYICVYIHNIYIYIYTYYQITLLHCVTLYSTRSGAVVLKTYATAWSNIM